MTRFYTGIGSRETPPHIKTVMYEIAVKLSQHYVLRSGGARGADKAFEMGAFSDESELGAIIYKAEGETPVWTNVFTDYFHPAPQHLNAYARKLMNRNAMQILGRDGNRLSDFVICWTKDGKDSGGTGQAIRIAHYFNIPVYNLRNKDDYDKITNYIDEGGLH